MKVIKDGIILDSKKNIDVEYASDELVEEISKQIEEEYAETFRLLAKGPNDTDE